MVLLWLNQHLDIVHTFLILVHLVNEGMMHPQLVQSVVVEKVELFLEIFGNILVRPQTAEYIKSSSTQLIK